MSIKLPAVLQDPDFNRRKINKKQLTYTKVFRKFFFSLSFLSLEKSGKLFYLEKRI